jgi:hypothetical protein
MSTVSEQWWDYVRRVGDEIAVKDFDVSVGPGDVDALIAETMSDEQLDELVQHMGRAFKPEMTRRSAFTSELFPMTPYMSLSTIDDFHTYGERVRLIDAAMPAEEIGRRLRDAPEGASPLWTWMAAYHFLTGRECLIQMGKVGRDQRLDDVRVVVDFWRRLTLAQRGDGTLDNKDAGFTNRYLPNDLVTRLQASAQPLEAAERKGLKRLNATVSGYSFLSFTDSRVGIYDSGPYPAGNGRVTILRDYLCLQPSVFGYEWMADLTAPFDTLTLVLTYDPASFTSFEINDWGTTFTEPEQLLDVVTHAAVIGRNRDGTSVRVEPTQWAELLTDVSKSHMQLYRTFADMTREERIFAATRMYSWGLKPFAGVAGVTDQIDWSVSADTMALYPDPLDDDAKAGAIFGGALVANDRPGAFSPLH